MDYLPQEKPQKQSLRYLFEKASDDGGGLNQIARERNLPVVHLHLSLCLCLSPSLSPSLSLSLSLSLCRTHERQQEPHLACAAFAD